MRLLIFTISTTILALFPIRRSLLPSPSLLSIHLRGLALEANAKLTEHFSFQNLRESRLKKNKPNPSDLIPTPPSHIHVLQHFSVREPSKSNLDLPLHVVCCSLRIQPFLAIWRSIESSIFHQSERGGGFYKEQNWMLGTDQRVRDISTCLAISRLPIHDSLLITCRACLYHWRSATRVAIDDKRSSHDETLSIKEKFA